MVVHDFVAMGLWREIGAFSGLSRAQRANIEHALGVVGLPAWRSVP
jgi:zinc/manganese transport system ATP-binding protein